MVPRGASRFFSNTVALVFQTTLATLITLAQVKILANHLPQGEFGLFASMRGLSLLVSMIAANGLPQLLVRYLPTREADGDAGDGLGSGSGSRDGHQGSRGVGLAVHWVLDVGSWRCLPRSSRHHLNIDGFGLDIFVNG